MFVGFPPLLWTPAFAGVTIGSAGWKIMASRAGARVYIHSNRSCRLEPAHEGMKIRCHPHFPSWIPAFAGITIALRRPHKRMKMSGRRVSKVRERAAPPVENNPQRHNPLPAPLDSGLRRNDGWGAGITGAREWWDSKSRSQTRNIIPDRSPGPAVVPSDKSGSGDAAMISSRRERTGESR